MIVKKNVLIAVWFLLVVGCAVNPVTGQRELVVVSDQQAIAIGTQQYAPAQQMQGGAYRTDVQLSHYVRQVGQKLSRYSGADLPYEFVVLNNSVPNAWALPGGKIAINRGLLAELSNEAELAAVLAHEIVHAAARHGAKRMERGLLSQGLVVATAIGASGTQYGGDLVNLAQGGANLLNQKYSRDAERESDYYGTKMMAQAGYDPYAAVTLQQTFLKLSGAQEQAFLQGLLASHPSSAERVANNRLLVQRLREEGYTDGTFGQAEFAAATATLRNAASAYEAYDLAVSNYQADATDAALSSVNEALRAYNADPHFHALRGRIRMGQQRWSDAVTNLDRAIALDDGYFGHHLLRGLAYNEQGESSQAQRDLDHSVRLLPTSQALHALGQIAESSGNSEAAKRYYEQAASARDSAGQAARASLVSLEINEQPAKYVAARLRRDDKGAFWVDVRNLTDLEVVNVSIRVELQSASGVRTETLRVRQLGAGQGTTSSVSAAQGVSGGRAYTVAASLAKQG